MKPNVDLTEDRKFTTTDVDIFQAEMDDMLSSTHLWGSLEINPIYFRRTYQRHPWDPNPLEIGDDNITSENSLVLLGNREERARTRYIRSFGAGVYCDRCGEKINAHPWDFCKTLCKNCAHAIMNDPISGEIFPWDRMSTR